MLPLLPLAGFALAGIGRLLAQRRAARQGAQGAAMGQAMNTSTATPTNTVGTAATSSPQTAQTPAGAANTGRVTKVGWGGKPVQPVAEGRTTVSPIETQGATGGLQSGTNLNTAMSQQSRQSMAQAQSGGDPNLAASLGQQAVERAKRRNLEQQQAQQLSGQALR